MSYIYLRESGAESLAESLAEIEPFVRWKFPNSGEGNYSNDKETGRCRGSRYGMMSKHFRGRNGAGELMLFAVGSLVRNLARRTTGARRLTIYGRKCCGFAMNRNLNLSLLKTSQKPQFSTREVTLKIVDSIADICDSMPRIAERHICESVGGYLATPTRTGNQTAQSMMKHPGCRAYVAMFGAGKIFPEHYEFLMGMPIGWSGLEPLETDKFRKWLESHGSF